MNWGATVDFSTTCYDKFQSWVLQTIFSKLLSQQGEKNAPSVGSWGGTTWEDIVELKRVGITNCIYLAHWEIRHFSHIELESRRQQLSGALAATLRR